MQISEANRSPWTTAEITCTVSRGINRPRGGRRVLNREGVHQVPPVRAILCPTYASQALLH